MGETEFVWVNASDVNNETPVRKLQKKNEGSKKSRRFLSKRKSKKLPVDAQFISPKLDSNNNNNNVKSLQQTGAPDFKIYDTTSKYKMAAIKTNMAEDISNMAAVEQPYWAELRMRSKSCSNHLNASPPPPLPPRRSLYIDNSPRFSRRMLVKSGSVADILDHSRGRKPALSDSLIV